MTGRAPSSTALPAALCRALESTFRRRGTTLPVDEIIDRLHAAMREGGLREVSRERLTRALGRLIDESHPGDWVTVHQGPEQAAADLLSAVGPRSGRYAFLAKRLLEKHEDASVASVEDAARGKLVSNRELEMYLLSLIGLSQRQIGRVLALLHGKR